MAETVADIIAQIAREKGVPVDLAMAIAQVESDLNPNAIGDGGHSVGLFQLNDNGEGAGMSVQAREDARTNAEIALTQVANVLREHPDWDWGTVAAAAQRPQDRAGYAAKVNKILGNGGVTNTGGTVAGTNTTLSGGPVLDEQSLAAEYGFAAAFFSIDPELQNLIKQATAEQWTPQKFQAEFQATHWYQSHAESVRNFLTLQKTDPQTFQAKLDQEVADVRNAAAQLGSQLDDATLKQIASNALEFGWDQAQLQQALGVHISLNSGGQAATNLESMRQYVKDMGIYMSDDTLQNSLRSIESGTSTLDTFQAQVRSLAASAFPQYAQQIQAGQTVKDIADPYIQDMAATLEMNPANISVYDPTIRKMLGGNPDKSGAPQPTSLYQFEQQLRQDPRWQYTKNAADAGYSLLHTIGQSWGFLS